METQPVVLVLLCSLLFFTGKSNNPLVDEGSIFVLLLGLYWWAMVVKHIIQPAIGEKSAKLLHLPSLFATLAIIEGTHAGFFNNALAIFLSLILVGWLWRRSIYRVEMGLQEEQLIASFKIGFVVLLATLLLASLNTNPMYKFLLNVLAYSLPTFFVSGLLALSFRRLSTIKKAYAHHSLPGAQASITRTWLSMLMFVFLIVAVSATILVVFVFQPLLIVFSPLEIILKMLYSWLLSFFRPSQIKHLNHRITKPVPPYKSIHLQPQHVYLPAILLLIFALVMSLLALFLLVMLFLFVRGILRKWNRTRTTDEDEVRESLSIRSIWRERRQKRQSRSKVVLEQLDPTSARSRYRELLQAMARHKENELGRQPDETPAEYQTRLLAFVKKNFYQEEQQYSKQSDATILNELTSAYILERYGGKASDHARRAYLRRRVPMLLKRLTRKKSRKG